MSIDINSIISEKELANYGAVSANLAARGLGSDTENSQWLYWANTRDLGSRWIEAADEIGQMISVIETQIMQALRDGQPGAITAFTNLINTKLEFAKSQFEIPAALKMAEDLNSANGNIRQLKDAFELAFPATESPKERKEREAKEKKKAEEKRAIEEAVAGAAAASVGTDAAAAAL